MHYLLTHRSLASLKAVAVTVLILALLALNAFAQRGRGTILGTVTDSTGAVIPAATVTITNTATNAATTAVTNDDGNFVAPNLNVGAYTVSATKAGFKKALRSGITLEVDQRADINLVLETGAVTETVEVSSQASLVDTTTATFGKVIENRRVEELPVNGRNALSLVLLAPAVQSGIGPTASGFADRGTQISFIRINGSPFASNNLVVDGLSSVNAYVPDVNINPNVDSVQEFKVQTNTMSAEYGFTLGGVVNLVTKAGTNAYHGTLYEFFRNNALDANSWANNRAARPIQPLRYNQYGGSIGGPIRLPKKVFGPLGYEGRDRSFFFYNYEGYRFVTNASGFYTMPTEAFRNGDFSKLADATGKPIIIYDPATTRANPSGNGFLRDPFPGNIIPANRIDIVSKNILKFYPLPNRTPDNAFTNLNNYFGAVSNKRTLSNHTSRVDHRFSEKNSFTARYSFYKQYTDQGTSNLYPDPVVRQRFDPFRGHNIVLSDLHNFTSNLIHEVRIGVARQIFDFKVASAGDGWPQQLGLPSIVPPDTFPAVSNGLPGFQTGTVGKRGSSVWQLFDSLTWLRGNHTLKFGTELRLTQANNLQKSSPSGSFNFPTTLTDNAAPVAGNRINTGNSFATFLLGSVGSASVTTHLGESEVGKAYGFYGNDEWKLRRNLSLSLGLRYDYQQQPYERRCGTSMFNPFVTNPTNGLKGATQYACVDYGRTFSETDKNDFAPRVGFSWDVRGNQKTVVRGGYGIFMASVFSFYVGNFDSTNGFAGTSTAYNPPNGNNLLTAFQFKDGFPFIPNQPQGAKLGPNLFATSSTSFREQIARTPMSQQWNLSLQQQLGGGFLVEVAYSANHGTHLLTGNYDLNQADPALVRQFGLAGQLTNNVANPYAGKVPGAFGGATITQAQAIRPFPYVGGITVQSPHQGNSIYHSLLVSAEKRFSKGFTLLASYTFAKLISDSIYNGLNFIGSEGGNEFGYQNGLYNRRAERAEDPSNVPHRLVVSGLFELPIGNGKKLDFKNGVANNILGNWQLNTITTIVQGTPTVVRGANNGLANRPDWIGSLELPSGFTDANPQRGVQWFNPAAFVNPALYTFGNTPRAISQFRNPGAVIIDLSVFKNFVITERLKLQFRAEAFNAPNHVNLGSPNTSFGAGPGGTNNNDAFGRITGSRDPRNMQLGLKLIF
ncbi:MAG TPA: carboxypeptidase regulatory-like domain-containing protein [Blastocatellia bacterium]|nr:carboxypeptidase regulatory-like domain-containing protein [Blastocatellia bacterium]